MTVLMLVGLLLIFLSIGVLSLPNRILNTESCKRNWCVIFTILTGGFLLIEQNDYAAFCAVFILAGIFINYAFPILLNVITAFNRKSDP
ncbi:hypothetical protein F965_00117 [Acinetobacter schindleri NIPH 900]|uniref:Uncharacterized protein n=1 Tax=Acinetobacter schindleri NIPH 900 TaxID=1217675 RepID=N8WS00_9GAMM|nr:hypothetical protein [Acinetobacter schindleri]ENV14771.1 hypothetical protein F965_00117 [Acinetobacter schindleri NIPH 900]